MNVRSVIPFLLIAAAGCDFSGDTNPVKEAFAASARDYGDGAAVAFRFPATRGRDARLYELPTLDEIRWRFDTGRSSAKAMVGFSADRDVVYFLTDADALAALDLATGRTRIVDSNVVAATMSPAAIPIIVHRDGSIASVELRSVVSWGTSISAKPTAVWGAARNGLLALVETDGSATLHLYRQGQTPVVQPLPQPDVVISPWGDAALVAADSGLFVLRPSEPTAATFLTVKPRPTLATFSPSGHRVYVVREDLRLVAFDRYSHNQVATLALPGPVDAGRMDPNGRFLMLRPVEGGTVWLVDVAAWSGPQPVAGEWDETFPTTAPDGTVLVRRGERVEALSRDSLTTRGAVTSRSDRWIVMAWDPRRLNLETAPTTGRQSELGGQLIYIQVSSTSNPSWAEDLAGNLRRAGMPATVLSPDREGEPYRVVLGPYPTRDEAEATGRQLGLPFWIFRRDTTSLNR